MGSRDHFVKRERVHVETGRPEKIQGLFRLYGIVAAIGYSIIPQGAVCNWHLALETDILF